MITTTTNLTHFHALLFDHVRRIRAEALDLLQTTDEITAILNDTSLAENDAQMRIQLALTIGKKIISEHGPKISPKTFRNQPGSRSQMFLRNPQNLVLPHIKCDDSSGQSQTVVRILF